MEQLNTKKSSVRLKSPCLWMQAGVIPKKTCKVDYRCAECHVDRELRRIAEENRQQKKGFSYSKGKKASIVFWKDKLRALPAWKQPCIHHMKQRIEFRACTSAYYCGRCEFDQYFNDHYSVHAAYNPVDLLEIEGFTIPQGFYFHPAHTWVRIEEGGSVRIGIDDFALRLLGPLDTITAPLMGKTIERNRGDIKVTRGEHSAVFLSPITGVVTDVNQELRKKTGLANNSPYSKGWVMRVHSKSLRKDIKKLTISGETKEALGRNVERLYDVIEETSGPLAADGGFLGNDIFGNVPGINWDRLTRIFLHN